MKAETGMRDEATDDKESQASLSLPCSIHALVYGFIMRTSSLQVVFTTGYESSLMGYHKCLLHRFLTAGTCAPHKHLHGGVFIVDQLPKTDTGKIQRKNVQTKLTTMTPN